VLQDHKDLLEPMALMDRKAKKVLLEQQELLAHKDHKDQQDLRGRQEQMVLMD
jgi:hypothetical protein